jgi:UDP-N-acetylmuramyl pentapeptide synthase
LNSRAIQPGDLYAALPGAKRHGADFASQAVAAGAVAILTDHDAAARATSVGFAAAVVAIHNDHFRRWLRDFSDDHRGELATAVDAVLARFMPATEPHVPGASGTGTDANKLYSAEEVLEIVRKALS